MTWPGGGPPVVGVDLGGTKILAGVISADNRILGARQTQYSRQGRRAGDSSSHDRVRDGSTRLRRGQTRGRGGRRHRLAGSRWT